MNGYNIDLGQVVAENSGHTSAKGDRARHTMLQEDRKRIGE